jgi:hypothetical protein
LHDVVKVLRVHPLVVLVRKPTVEPEENYRKGCP